MIDEKNLRSMIQDLESDRIERTTATNDFDKFSKAICAFANDMPNHRQPGYLLIGVRDNGTVAGLKATDELLRNLDGIRSDGNVLPSPVICIKKFTMDEGDIVVVEVLPSDMPPVRYRGKIWIRVGPRKASATEQEERMLTEKRTARAHSFDMAPCSEATLQDLSIRLFTDYRAQAIDEEVIAAKNRSIEHQLASLRLFDYRRMCPTVAGILLFGTNPRFFLPGAYIQFLRFPGKSMTEEPIDQEEISGDLRTVLETIKGKVVAHNHTALTRGNGFQERQVKSYPEWALRELLHNAVMHRDYESNSPSRFYWFEDRIEIQSPGGLYGEVTPESFPYRNSYRNPVIAEALKAMGYVNRFGYGVQRANHLLVENGNPEARFSFEDRIVAVTVQRSTP